MASSPTHHIMFNGDDADDPGDSEDQEQLMHLYQKGVQPTLRKKGNKLPFLCGHDSLHSTFRVWTLYYGLLGSPLRVSSTRFQWHPRPLDVWCTWPLGQ